MESCSRKFPICVAKKSIFKENKYLFTKKYILVVGAVHLDTMADYRPQERENTNKIGKLHYAVGGASYNVAVNLANQQIPVRLFTCVDPKSPTTAAIRNCLSNNNLSQEFVYDRDFPEEAGWVAHFEEDELVSGVTSPGIENVDLPIDDLNRAIAGASLVAVDTNLNITQIKLVSRLCKRHDVPLLVGIVSDSKVARILDKPSEFDVVFGAVSMNQYEARHAGIQVAKLPESSPEELAKLCNRFNTSHVYITCEQEGFLMLTKAYCHVGLAPQVGRIVKDSGAGDAFFTSVCMAVYKQRDLTHPEALSDMHTCVAHVLNQEAANLGISDFTSPSLRRGKDIITRRTVITSVPILLICTGLAFMPGLSPLAFIVCSFVAAIAAGALGGNISEMAKRGNEWVHDDTFKSVVLGGIAGFVSSLLFLGAQLTTNYDAWLEQIGASNQWSLRSEIDGTARLLIIFVTVVSLAGGVAYEPVIQRLRQDSGEVRREIENPTNPL